MIKSTDTDFDAAITDPSFQTAIAQIGFPHSHCKAFQKVAKESKCIIASRDVGMYATTLIEEGYGSKSFKNHSKTCSWGPMAGFVLTEWRFSKIGLQGKEQTQKDYLRHAFHNGCTKIPLTITERRRMKLVRSGWIGVQNDSWGLIRPFQPIPSRTQVAPEGAEDIDRVETSLFRADRTVRYYKAFVGHLEKLNTNLQAWASNLVFVLLKNDEGNWDVYYDDPSLLFAKHRRQRVYALKDWNWDERKSGIFFQAASNTGSSKDAPRFGAQGFKQATVGDYDLFLIWKEKEDDWLGEKWITVKGGEKVDDGTQGGRVVSLMDLPLVAGDLGKPKNKLTNESNEAFQARIKAWEDQEHPTLANPTQNHMSVRFLLNEEIRSTGKYAGGDMVHHSAESGRPFIDDISTPSIVFFPDGHIWVLEKNANDPEGCGGATDLVKLFNATKDEYNVFLNPIWIDVIKKVQGLTAPPEGWDYFATVTNISARDWWSTDPMKPATT